MFTGEEDFQAEKKDPLGNYLVCGSPQSVSWSFQFVTLKRIRFGDDTWREISYLFKVMRRTRNS